MFALCIWTWGKLYVCLDPKGRSCFEKKYENKWKQQDESTWGERSVKHVPYKGILQSSSLQGVLQTNSSQQGPPIKLKIRTNLSIQLPQKLSMSHLTCTQRSPPSILFDIKLVILHTICELDVLCRWRQVKQRTGVHAGDKKIEKSQKFIFWKKINNFDVTHVIFNVASNFRFVGFAILTFWGRLDYFFELHLCFPHPFSCAELISMALMPFLPTARPRDFKIELFWVFWPLGIPFLAKNIV